MIQKTRNWAFAAMMIWGIGSSMAQQRNTLFNDDWEFIKEGQEAVTVDLPHDWSILGVPSADEPSGNDGGYYPTGKAQYRKVLHLGQLSSDRRYALYFEGVYMNAEVVVNGVSTGVQHYGYSSFLRDVTKLLHEGDNEIVVNVDNSQQRNTRWYSGSGIYRHVWLIETADVHFKHWGTFITTPIVDAEGTSQVSVKTTLVNESDRERIMQVKVCLQGATDDGGDLSATKETIIRLQPNEERQAELLIDVPNAHLWSPDTPYLYEANLSVSEQGNPNKTIDQVTETFGIRSIAFNAEQGFLLNGQPIELNGGCLHHDNGILGASAFDRAEERKAELMKAAGFNAVRTSHNHPSSAFLDACDRIGLLVIDEAFDGWRSAKTPHDYSKYI
ncbi:MAG: beta-galactosidase, partial [Bacteroidaceae bacterium]|nr:beta-galactosidase [Bacteroidaceae bacterium]